MRLDDIDRRLLDLLQSNARMPWSELARSVGLSAPAVADRARRLEESGVISGYHAHVDPEALGYQLRAVVRMRPDRHADEVAVYAAKEPGVLTAHRVTGGDCYVFDVIARSMADLESMLDRLMEYGSIVTSVVLSSPVQHRVVLPPQ